jgi:hypothetical protein
MSDDSPPNWRPNWRPRREPATGPLARQAIEERMNPTPLDDELMTDDELRRLAKLTLQSVCRHGKVESAQVSAAKALHDILPSTSNSGSENALAKLVRLVAANDEK